MSKFIAILLTIVALFLLFLHLKNVLETVNDLLELCEEE